MKQALLIACAGALAMIAPAALPAAPPANWDGLAQVKSKRFDLVYLMPGADFRGYAKVMLDPTEVAFHKDWQRDYNRSARGANRISDSEVQRAIEEAIVAATDIFTKAFQAGGYTVVAAPGPDVLRVKTGVLNVSVTAPDKLTAGRSRTFANEAGSAVLFVEARDSSTNALLGRAVDQKIAGEGGSAYRTGASNRADFRFMVEQWAKDSVRGLTELKSLSPPSQ